MKQYFLHAIIWLVIGSIEYYFIKNGWQEHFFLILAPAFVGMLLSDAVRIHYQEKKSQRSK